MFRTTTLLLLTVAFSTMAGCAKKAPESETPATTPAENETAAATPVSPHPNELVGIWWGTAALNEDALARAMQELSPLEQQKVIAAAEAFLATEIAIEFKPDGNMESAMEIQTRSGQREPGVEFAKWTASPMTIDREFKVQTTSQTADGTQSRDEKIIRLSQTGEQISFKVNIPGSVALGRCSPQFVLQRQRIEEVAQEPASQIR